MLHDLTDMDDMENLDERLIDEVQLHTCLYIPTRSDFKDQMGEKKENAWGAIDGSLGKDCQNGYLSAEPV